MALPSSGSISLSQVNVELKKSATAAISMGDSAVRALAKKTSGAISMSDLRGKSAEVKYTNTVNRTQASIHALMGSPTAVTTYIFENTATISAASRGGWALQTGAFPAGSTLRIINRGAIRGGGGNGGASGAVGGAGGSALVINFPATIDNTGGTIWGGGGGGGSAASGVISAGGGGGGGIPAGAGGGGLVVGAGGSVTGGGKGGYVASTMSGGTGGGVGAAGGAAVGGVGGGRGGYSVQRNSNAVTWAAVGDRRGAVV